MFACIAWVTRSVCLPLSSLHGITLEQLFHVREFRGWCCTDCCINSNTKYTFLQNRLIDCARVLHRGSILQWVCGHYLPSAIHSKSMAMPLQWSHGCSVLSHDRWRHRNVAAGAIIFSAVGTFTAAALLSPISWPHSAAMPWKMFLRQTATLLSVLSETKRPGCRTSKCVLFVKGTCNQKRHGVDISFLPPLYVGTGWIAFGDIQWKLPTEPTWHCNRCHIMHPELTVHKCTLSQKKKLEAEKRGQLCGYLTFTICQYCHGVSLCFSLHALQKQLDVGPSLRFSSFWQIAISRGPSVRAP